MKEALKQEKLVARMVLAESNLIDWRQEQLQDPEISVFLLGKELMNGQPGRRLHPKGRPRKFTDLIGIL